ncbi:MAG: right-handed parallel beta-helix repeat-containing protein [Candidatus Micrarchaeia archaeon]
MQGRLAVFVFILDITLFLALLSIFATFSNDTFSIYTQQIGNVSNESLAIQDEMQAKWNTDTAQPPSSTQNEAGVLPSVGLPLQANNPDNEDLSEQQEMQQWNADNIKSDIGEMDTSSNNAIYADISKIQVDEDKTQNATGLYVDIVDIASEPLPPVPESNLSEADTMEPPSEETADESAIDWGLAPEEPLSNASSELGIGLNQTAIDDYTLTEDIDLSRTANYQESVADNKKVVSSGSIRISADKEVYCLYDNICDVPIDIENMDSQNTVEILMDDVKFSDAKAVKAVSLHRGKKTEAGFKIYEKVSKKKPKAAGRDYDAVILGPGESKTVFLRVNASESVEWSMRFYTPEGWVTLDPTIYIGFCGNLDTEGNTYVLMRSISGVQSDNHCININANNVILSCNGYTISSSSNDATSVGIYAENRRNILITSCTVTGYGVNILFDNVNNSEITNTNVYNAYGTIVYGTKIGGVGISLSNSLDVNITNSIARRNKYDGILVTSSNNTLIRTSKLLANEYCGVNIISSTGSFIDRSNFTVYTGGIPIQTYYGYRGVCSVNSEYTTIQKGLIEGHTNAGIYTEGSKYIIVNSTQFGFKTNNESVKFVNTNSSIIANSVFNFSTVDILALHVIKSRNISVASNRINGIITGIWLNESNATIFNNSFYSLVLEIYIQNYYGGNSIQYNKFNRRLLSENVPAIIFENKQDSTKDIIRHNKINPPPNQPANDPLYQSFVEISKASNIEISSNNISSCTFGVSLSEGTLSPSFKKTLWDINISNNKIFNTSIGVYVNYLVEILANSEISGNTLDLVNTSRLPQTITSVVFSYYSNLYNVSINRNNVQNIGKSEFCSGIIALNISESRIIGNRFMNSSGCEIQDNKGYIYVRNMINSNISNNIAKDGTYLLKDMDISNKLIENISFYNNTCYLLKSCFSCVTTLKNVTIAKNNVTNTGVGFFITGVAENITFVYNTFYKNAISIYFASSKDGLNISGNYFEQFIDTQEFGVPTAIVMIDMQNAKVYNNTIKDTNGGITILANSIHSSSIYNNTIEGPFGGSLLISDLGGIFIYYLKSVANPNSLQIFNNHIDGKCGGCAWGITAYSDEMNLAYTEIYNNTIKGMEGALHIKNLISIDVYDNRFVDAGQSVVSNVLISKFENNTFTNTRKLTGTTLSFFKFNNNTFSSNSNGIVLSEIAYSNITNNQLVDVIDGADVSYGKEILIANNSINRCGSSCMIIREFMYEGVNKFLNNSFSNCGGYGLYLNNVTFAKIENAYIQNTTNYGLYAINYLVGTGDYAIVFNNIQIYNTSSPLFVNRSVNYLKNPRFVGLVMGYNSSIGKIKMGDFYIQYTDVNTTNYRAAPDFVSLNAPTLTNIPANITLNTSSCNKLKIYKKPGFPTSRNEILTYGLLCPNCRLLSCTGDYVLFNVTSFSGYTTSSDIYSCIIINESGNYKIKNNLEGAPIDVHLADLGMDAKVCVEINASNVVFDCDGHFIRNTDVGGTTGGIFVDTRRSNVTVKNCNVSKYMYGITVYNASNSIITNNKVHNNWVGINLLHNTYNITVVNNTVYNSSSANIISQNFAHFTSYNIIKNNTASFGAYGLRVIKDDNIQISNSTYHSSQHNLYITSSQVTLSNMRIYNGSSTDFVFYPDTSSSITAAGITFDSPTNGLSKFTNLSFTDTSSIPYYMKWSSAPASPPAGRVSFKDKYVLINSTTTSIDNVVFTWSDSELPGYDEGTFELWGYNYTSGSWVLFNNTPDTANNQIRLSNVNFPAVYGLFSFTGSSCGVISSSGTYILFNNVTGAPVLVSLPEVGMQVRACIDVNASNVILDCMGYAVKNDGTLGPNGAVGILVDSTRSNVTIRNCKVLNYTQGIATYNAQNNKIYNNTIYNNSQYGAIIFYNSQNNLLTNNTLYNNTLGGLAVRYLSPSNNLTRNIIYQSAQDGVYVSLTSNKNLIHNNTIYRVGRYGVYIDTSHNNTITSNRIYYTTNNGIALGSSQNTTIQDNTVHSGNVYGISLASSSYNKVINNTLYNYTNTNYGYAVYLTASHYNNISLNNIYNGRYGYVVVGSSNYNKIFRNRAYNFTRDGYAIGYSSSHNIVAFNNASKCSYYAYEIYQSAYNTTLANNTGRQNYVGIYLNTKANTISLYNNTIGTNQYYSLWINNATNVFVDRDHYYNNTNDIRVLNGPLTYNLSNVMIDSPAGIKQNYTILSLNDVVPSSEQYYIKWTTNSSALPTDAVSFRRKFVDISTISGTPSIDKIVWHWDDQETSGYNENRFSLFKYSSGVWSQVNQSPDVNFNTLSLFNHNPASIYGILENTTSICMVINQPGRYTIRNDIYGAPNTGLPYVNKNVCIFVNTSNVEFDCNGYSISNNGVSNAIGVLSVYRDNVTVKNCSITGYKNGIFLQGVFDSKLINNTVDSSEEHGIQLYLESYGNLVENNTVSNSGGVGILIDVSNRNIIRGNKVYNAAAGIVPYTSSPYNLIDNNTVYSCTPYGGIATFSGYNNFTNNVVYNSENGIYIQNANNNYISGNILRKNSIGLSINNGNDSIAQYNTIHNNTNTGIYVGYSENNTFRNSLLANNTNYGIIIHSSFNSSISNVTAERNLVGIHLGNNVNVSLNLSTARYNSLAGFRIIGGQRNLITNSIAHNNNDGIYLEISNNNQLSNVSAYYNTNGVLLQNSNRTLIRNSRAYQNTQFGFAINDSNYNNITDSYTSTNTGSEISSGVAIAFNSRNNILQNYTSYADLIGILIYNADNNIINSSNITQAYYSIYLAGTNNDYNSVINTTIKSQYHGIYSEGGTNNKYFNNTLIGPGGNGVGIYMKTGGESFNITRNIITQFKRGIHLESASCSDIFIDYNTVYGNSEYCIIEGGLNNKVRGNTVYNCLYGIFTAGSSSTMKNNEISGSGYGLFLQSPAALTANDTHLFNNSYDFYVGSISSGSYIRINNLTIDNPLGNFVNYTTLNLTDNYDAGASYYINWSSLNGITLPKMKRVFRNKVIDIKIASGTPSIDSISWQWKDSEVSGYDEGRLQLWKRNSTGWHLLNSTPNIQQNTLSLSNHIPLSNYTILESVNCPIINESGAYLMDSNYTGAPNAADPFSGYACVKITASNVIFDCGGYSIKNSGVQDSFGMLINGSVTNVTVSNCKVDGYDYNYVSYNSNLTKLLNSTLEDSQFNAYVYIGRNITLSGLVLNNSESHSIFVSTARDVLISNNTINYSTDGAGILVYRVNSSNILNNTVDWSYAGIGIYSEANSINITKNQVYNTQIYGGIFVNNADGIIITNNSGQNNNDGIYVSQVTSSKIVNNTFSQNFGYGARVLDSRNVEINSNIFFDNFEDGFYSSNLNDSRIIKNVIYLNKKEGCVFYKGRNNTIHNNTVYTNSKDGFDFTWSSYNNITSNIAYNNTQYGFAIGSSQNNSVSNNLAYNNSIGGFNVYYESTIQIGSNNNTLVNNTAERNRQFGFFIYRSSNNKFANNTARHNVNVSFALIRSNNNTLVNSSLYNSSFLVFVNESNYNNISYNSIYNSTYDCVAFMYNSNGNHLSHNQIYNCNYHGIEVNYYAYNITIIANNISGTAVNGIDLTRSFNNTIWLNNITNAYVAISLDRVNNTNIFGNRLYANRMAGMLFLRANNNDAANNSIYLNPVGASISGSVNTSLANNTLHSSSTVGYVFENQNNSIVSNEHIYNNSYDIFINSTFSGFVINITNTSIDNPLGNYVNYTRIYLSDVIDAGTSYVINWTSQPASLPTQRSSFRGKYLRISPIEGTPSIDSIKWHWADSETVGYKEQKLELWKYNTTHGWVLLNNTPDTVSNFLSLSDVVPLSEYGILQRNDSECFKISSSGSYVLYNNITGAPYTVYLSDINKQIAVCVEINSSNVVFDCMGYSVRNNGTNSIDGSIGVLVDANRQNVTVRNCKVQNYTHGVTTYLASGNFIHNNTVFNNSQFGILLAYMSNYNNVENNTLYNNSAAGLGAYISSQYNNFTNNTAYSNLYGFYIYASNSNKIIRGKSSNNSYGVRIEYSNNNNFTLYNSSNNSYDGFYLIGSVQNIINSSIASFNSQNGIVLRDGSTDNVIRNSTFTRNTAAGISIIRDSHNSKILQNNVSFNGQGGMIIHSYNLVLSVMYTNLSGNDIYNNSQFGILIGDRSPYSYIYNNSIHHNYGDGVLTASSNNTLMLNKVYRNQGHGLYFYPSRNQTIYGNSVYNNSYGITLSYCGNSSIILNNVTQNSNAGMLIYGTESTIITNNTVRLNQEGMLFQSNSQNNFIGSNKIANNSYYGIHMVESGNNLIKNNIFENHTTNNGKSILAEFVSNITVLENVFRMNYEHIRLRNSATSNISENNMSLSYSHATNVYNSSRINVSSNRISFAVFGGGIVYELGNLSVAYRNVINNSAFGIATNSSNHSIFENNTVYNCGSGAYAGYVIYQSYNNTMRNNIGYNNNPDGVLVYMSTSSNIINNTMYSNTKNGFDVFESSYNALNNNTAYLNGEYGFILNGAVYNNVTGGKSYNNSYSGYLLIGGTNNRLVNVSSYNNTQHGVMLDGTGYNLIANSTFIDNKYSGVHFLGVSEDNFIEFNYIRNPSALYGGVYIISSVRVYANNNTVVSNTYGINSVNSNTIFLSGNNISRNTVKGIYLDQNSLTYTLSSNYICFNDNMDIENNYINGMISSSGQKDYCDYWYQWAENNHYGCEFSCSGLWQRFFGNVNGSIYLTDSEGGLSRYVYKWNDAKAVNVYFADGDSIIDWQALQAIGRDTSGGASSNDFIELDTAFSSTSFPDNINKTYSIDGTIPKETDSYAIYKRTVENVPVANSSLRPTQFKTGILWDTSDGGSEYSGTQSTVWAVKASPSPEPDTYGEYMYAAMIPYTLATYEGAGNTITIYIELE